MRAAVLQFCFDHLGVDVATSAARRTNTRSLGVSMASGYRENVRVPAVFGDDSADEMVMLRLDRADWEPQRRNDIVVTGFEPCRSLFDLD